jgi:uncharacterized protein (DUF305 family)
MNMNIMNIHQVCRRRSRSSLHLFGAASVAILASFAGCDDAPGTPADARIADAARDRAADAPANAATPDAGAGANSRDGGSGPGVDASMDRPGTDAATGRPASGVEIRGDRRVPFAPNNDVEFIDFFVPHHQMAIEMAQMVLDRGASAELEEMATRMKTDQTGEIAEMRAARMALTGSADSPAAPPDVTQDRRMAEMRALSGTALDRMFQIDMIAHHAGALPAAHRAVPFLQRSDMQALARRIQEAQAEEIGDLKEMLGDLGPGDHGPGASDAGAPGSDGGAAGEETALVGDRRVPYTPPNDLGFTDFFIIHHEMAVEMAALVIDRGASGEVRSMATMMRQTQLREIMEMKAARLALGAPEDPTPAPPDPIMEGEMAHMRTLSGSELDRMFLEEMIPHHAGGLPTALRAIPNLQRSDMQEMAMDIYNAQAEEIGEMHTLLASRPVADGGTD